MPRSRLERRLRDQQRRRIRRRRLTALAALGILAWTGGMLLGARDAARELESNRLVSAHERGKSIGLPERRAQSREEARLGATSALVRRAGRTIVMRFEGTKAPAYVLRALRVQRAAGVILFRDNVVSAAQVRRLTSSIREASGGRALIMIDQEGGPIRILRWAPPQQAPAALGSPAAAAAQGRAAAQTLRSHGFNVNLAPVADVATTPGSVMRSRAFPGDAGDVASLVAANVKAYAGTKVLPTVKHFPGLGASTANTDFRSATVPGRGELRSFRAAIDAGVPIVMSSHALYPELDPKRIASQSKGILETVLRGRLGFKGVVITDSLEARAVVERSPTPVAAVRSMAAGNDLLLTTGKASYLQVLRALVRRAKRDPAFLARVREAEARVAGLPRG
jgi:beta-N-acetylhexosaminidase